MSDLPKINFVKPAVPSSGTVVLLAAEGEKGGETTQALGLSETVRRAAEAARFKYKSMSSLDILAPGESKLSRAIVIGTGKVADLAEHDWLRLGGAAMGVLHKGESVTVLLERPDGQAVTPTEAADFALGMVLRAYSFNRYKKEKDDTDSDNGRRPATVSIAYAGHKEMAGLWNEQSVVAEGVLLARDLINEPANMLGPVELAERVEALAKHGVDVEILGEPELKKLGMRALLGVSQGSVRPPRVAVLRWNGAGDDSAPIAFVGKGVVFDSGGISIKPAQSMEDMKGDMGGAAAVIGLFRVLAGRAAKVNAIGIVGLVENMVDGNAQRPGDIVRSMSGQTIEIINTDAEGRLVLADLLHYVQEEMKPKMIVDLATLTGAIIVALGHLHAGLFTTDDKLAAALTDAGEKTGEKLWRMPLGPDYDKLMDSKFADVKNAGGRDAGSITAAQFLKRFVKKGQAWAHLDIAGTAMGSPQTEINRSWSSGFGVRLLNRLVADHYEKK
jgi:leucyl aminopeptidase